MYVKKISLYALVISIYTAISLLLGGFSFGIVQIRLSELLLVLCLDYKEMILPVTLGCLLTNIIGVLNGTNMMSIDIVFGTLATFISAILVYKFRNIKFYNKPVLSLLIPVLINGIIVGIEIAFYFYINIYLSIAYVAIGEFVSVSILGLLLYKQLNQAIKKYII